MLSAFLHRNFRLYFTAQTVSNVGTWVQITVENWLVLELSGALMSALGFGAAVGSLLFAVRPRTGLPVILLCTCAVAAAQFAVAAVHDLRALIVAIFAYGVTAGLFSVSVISTLQSHTAEHMRGRVMAAYSICFLGSSPVGGPAFGALAEWIGVSGALRVTGSVCAAVALIAGAVLYPSRGRAPANRRS